MLTVAFVRQLVSLLLELEQMSVCRGSSVSSSGCRLQVRSAACHLLVTPPCVTCVTCLLQDEEETDEEEEDGEDDGEGRDEEREEELDSKGQVLLNNTSFLQD